MCIGLSPGLGWGGTSVAPMGWASPRQAGDIPAVIVHSQPHCPPRRSHADWSASCSSGASVLFGSIARGLVARYPKMWASADRPWSRSCVECALGADLLKGFSSPMGLMAAPMVVARGCADDCVDDYDLLRPLLGRPPGMPMPPASSVPPGVQLISATRGPLPTSTPPRRVLTPRRSHRARSTRFVPFPPLASGIIG